MIYVCDLRACHALEIARLEALPPPDPPLACLRACGLLPSLAFPVSKQL